MSNSINGGQNRRNRNNKRKRDSDNKGPPTKKRKLNITNTSNTSDTTDGLWNDFNKYYKPVTPITDPWKDWVSATVVKNYLIKDPCLDWIKYHYNFNPTNGHNSRNIPNKKRGQLKILFKMGNKFEECVFKYIENKYPGCVEKVVEDYSDVKQENMKKTVDYIKKGVPFIEQALLYNHSNHTFGVADILVRSDWINKLFNKKIIPDNEMFIKAPKLNGNYHYLVIDIKWATLSLCSNGTNVLNSKLYPAYKGQLAIYTAALGLVQGYTPSKAYILAKSWEYTKKNNKKRGYNCFDLLGQVDYNGFDKTYLKKTWDAIKWIRDVRIYGSLWGTDPPSVPELYPNMNNKYDTPYHNIKCKIAENIDELTEIWMVGTKNRQHAHDNNVYKWSDPNCTLDVLGIHGKKTGPVIQHILDINRDTTDKIIEPNRIRNNEYDWQNHKGIEFYVDFETINECLYDESITLGNSKRNGCFIFMIGVGYIDNYRVNSPNLNKWKYKVFVAKSIDMQSEKDVIQQFTNFINDKVNEHMRKYRIRDKTLCYPSIMHWGHAEKSMLNGANRRHNYIWSNWKDKVIWVDMYNIFKNEPIVIKGVKSFGLKGISKAMYNYGYIKSTWDKDGPGDGLSAMMKAISYYKFMNKYNNSPHNNRGVSREHKCHKEKFDKIIKYNEIDCRVLWEIITYLRLNHC